MLNKFKKKLSNGEAVIGPFMKTSDPAFVEAAGYSGFDYAILDMEHGPVSYETMQNNIRAAQISGMVPIIRVADSDENGISKALDIGALGVQVPQVQNARQAEKVVKAAKFSPIGERGVCRFVRAAKYSSMDRNDYFSTANERLVILQLEGEEAINNLDEILIVEGYDIIFIGPYDLSQSLNVPGEISHPKVIEKMKYIVDKAKDNKTVVGTFVDTIELLKVWKNAGLQYLSYSVDVGLFSDACKSIVGIIKK